MSKFCKGMRVIPMFFPVDPLGTKHMQNTRGLIETRPSPLTILSVRPLNGETCALTFKERPGFEYESCFFKNVSTDVPTAP